MNILICDIETNNYLHPWDCEPNPHVLCLIGIDYDTGRVVCSGYKQFLEALKNYDAVAFHFGIEYDLRVLSELEGLKYEIARHTRLNSATLDKVDNNPIRVIDTCVLSKLVYPERFTHGLEDWGVEFGIPKPTTDFVDGEFHTILYRCATDCEITRKLLKKIFKDSKGQNIKDAYAREKHVSDINQRRVTAGVGFNKELALKHCDTLDWKCKPLAARILPHLPRETPLPPGQIKYPPKVGRRFKNNGELHADAIRYWGADVDKDAVRAWSENRPLTTHKPTTMKDNAVVKQWLMDEGWKPQFWNKNKKGERTTPKIRDNGNICPSLLVLAERIPEINDYVLYATLQHRRNTLKSQVNDKKGLLNHPRLDYDGRLPAGADANGAITRRMTHKVVANVPRYTADKEGNQTSVFGKEMRELFTA